MSRSFAARLACAPLAAFLWSSSAYAVPRPAAPVLPTGPSPFTFSIQPVPGTWQWRWTLRNVSGAPIEVASDRRLVWFEVQPPPADPATRRRQRRAAPVRCAFEARPSIPEFAARTELASSGSYSELVDLRDVCRLRVPAAMPPGALVVAHYGVAPLTTTGRVTRALARRWMARTLVFDGRSYPVNDLTATVAVPDGEAPAGPAPGQGPASGLLVAAASVQAATGPGLRVTARVRNQGSQPLWALVRTVQFSFELVTPSGRSVTCDALSREPSPFRDLFARLGPGATRATGLAPSEYCPIGAFDEAGLYRARVVYRSTATGEPWLRGRAFTGRITSEPFLFRIWRGDSRYQPIGLEISG